MACFKLTIEYVIMTGNKSILLVEFGLVWFVLRPCSTVCTELFQIVLTPLEDCSLCIKTELIEMYKVKTVRIT